MVQWAKEQIVTPLWCAIKLKNVDTLGQSVGFIFSNWCGELYYDKETYPYLSALYYRKMAEEVENHGLNIYVLVIISEKDTLLNFSNSDGMLIFI